MGLTLADHERELQEQIARQDEIIARLRALLWEVVQKCDHYQNQPKETCTKIATWWAEDVVSDRVILYYCEEHRYDYGVNFEPYEIGRRIKAVLEMTE